MIDRYTRPEMGALFKDRHKYDTWLKVELAVCEAWAAQGAIPGPALSRIKSKAGFTIRQIEEIEAKTHHDVIAFTTAVGERIGADSAYFHKGLTSSDVVDTAGNLVLKEAGQLLEEGLLRLRGALGQLALRYKHTPCIGRTHGVHAEPTTFGLRLLVWYDELGRHEERLADAIDMIAVGKLSGAVGNFAHIPPSFEEQVLKSLGLQPAPVSNQVVQRDRHAQFVTTLALLAATMEKIAINLRTLQRTEIYETLEPFAKGQKGSSAMPHKQNPILLERITGLARVLRGYAVTALENVALWDERDISHSGAERIILPDACITVDYMLHKLAGVLEGLVVHEDQMQANLRATHGLIFSQRVLLKLTEAGMSREAAYALVQRNALACWQDGKPLNDALLGDHEVRAVLSAPQINELFTLAPYLAQVDALFKRVGLTEREAADAAAGKRRRGRGWSRRSTDAPEERGGGGGRGVPDYAPVQNISERPSEWYESAALATASKDGRWRAEGDETLGEADHQKRPPRRDSPQGQALAAEKVKTRGSRGARGGRGRGPAGNAAPPEGAPALEAPTKPPLPAQPEARLGARPVEPASAEPDLPPAEGDAADKPKRRRRGSRGGRRHKKPETPATPAEE